MQRGRPSSAGRDDTDASRQDPISNPDASGARPSARADGMTTPLEEKMMNRQTWFVTGAASLLGADIVRRALAAGHRVVAVDPEPLAALQRLADVASERLLLLPLDEIDAHEVGHVVQAVVDRFGGIDVLVHGAAACSPRSPVDAPTPAHDFSASVRSLFNITRGVLEAMREQGAGRIHHLVPPPELRRGPTLFSIAGFCDAVAADVAPFGIEVTAVPSDEAMALLRAASGRDRGELLEEA